MIRPLKNAKHGIARARSFRDSSLIAGGFWGGVLREPLWPMLLAGGVLAWLGGAFAPAPDRYRIRLGDEDQERLAQNFLRQYGTTPTEAQLKDLEANFIRAAIEYREGIDLGLDQDDAIVRRRVGQKYEFLQQDRIAEREPDDKELLEWYAAHRERYAEPERVTFTHVFFAADRGGEAEARKRAEKALEDLRASGAERAPGRGDAFADAYDYAALDAGAARRTFGATELPKALFKIPVGRWEGPYASGYGIHLVRVTGKKSPQTVFSEVRAKVRQDWLDEFRRRENERAFANVSARYKVVSR
jgi:parvulin-like peptidyl-prolyl isomerase